MPPVRDAAGGSSILWQLCRGFKSSLKALSRFRLYERSSSDWEVIHGFRDAAENFFEGVWVGW